MRCRKFPLRAHKNAVFTRFRHAANTRRDIPHTPDRKLISKYPKNTPHRNPQTTPQGIPQSTPQTQKLQIAFIFPAKCLHFTRIQPPIEFPFLDIVSFNGTDITLQLFVHDSNRQRTKRTVLLLKSRLLGSQKTLFVNYLFTKLS